MRMIKVENKRESAKKKEIEQSRKENISIMLVFMFFEWQKEFIHLKIFTISDWNEVILGFYIFNRAA